MTEPQPYETFVSALVDHALSRPLRDWLHSESLIALVEAVLATPEWVAIAEAQTRPLLERQQLRVAAVDSQLPATDRERLEAYLDEQSRAAIVSIIRDLPPIPPEALRELLKRDDVRPHLQRFFEDALERVIAAMNRRTGGLVGALGRGAFDAASRFGRKVLGDHVPKVDEQLKKLVQSAVSQSLSLAIEQLATRAAHPKSQAEIRSRVATSTRRLFRLPTEAALEPLLALPLEAIAAVVSAVLRHNLARPEIRRVVVDELRLFVDALGDRPVGDWLGDRRAAFARDLRELLGPLFAGFFASADYASWLAEASKRTPTIATDGNPSDSS